MISYSEYFTIFLVLYNFDYYKNIIVLIEFINPKSD